jgi:hypothetical protein
LASHSTCEDTLFESARAITNARACGLLLHGRIELPKLIGFPIDRAPRAGAGSLGYAGENVMPPSSVVRSLVVAALIGIPAMALSETAAPPGASVYFISPKDGDTVTSPFKVQFGLSGMGVAPAGVDKPKTGHHHLIIDATLSPEELKQPIAADAKHVHFGGGQTEAMVTLEPGQHTLQLVLGDWSHIPFDPPITSPVITVTVQ